VPKCLVPTKSHLISLCFVSLWYRDIGITSMDSFGKLLCVWTFEDTNLSPQLDPLICYLGKNDKNAENWFATFVYFKLSLKCLVCFIPTVHNSYSLNSADVPLRNKQTNKQVCYHMVTIVIGLSKLYQKYWLKSGCCLYCFVQIKGTFASRHGEDVFNPYSHGSALANYCGLMYGPLQPR